jgi:hypothetical protein
MDFRNHPNPGLFRFPNRCDFVVALTRVHKEAINVKAKSTVACILPTLWIVERGLSGDVAFVAMYFFCLLKNHGIGPRYEKGLEFAKNLVP